jgi:hypothetical protein
MVTGDVCASGRNVPYSAALQVATQPSALAAVCAMAPATLHARPGPAGSWACGLSPSFDLPSGDTIFLNASASLPDYVGALLGQGRCGAADPWAPIVSQAVSYVRTVPYSQLTALVGSAPAGAAAPLTGKQVVALRPPLWSVAAAATNATANVLADHLASAAAQLGSCNALSAALQSTSDAVCCSLFSPLYWMASVFYLIGWAYCCCGLPAGLLGRKRLVSRPWGPYADPAEAAAAAQKRAAAAARRRQRGRSGGFVQPGGAGAAADAESALAAKYAATASADSGAGGYGSVDDAGVELTASETPPLTGQAAPAAGGAPPALGVGMHGLPIAAQGAYSASSYAGLAAYAPVGLGTGAVPAGASPAGAYPAGAGAAGAHGLSGHPGGPSARRMGPWGMMNSIAVYRRPKEGLMRGRSVRGANGGGSPSRGEGTGAGAGGGGEDPSEGATPRPAAGPAAVNAAAAAAAAAAVVDSMGVGGRSSVLPPDPYSALNPLGLGGAPAAALAGSPAGGALGAGGGSGLSPRPFAGPITYSVPGGYAAVPTPAAPVYPGLYPSLPALHFAGTPGAAAALHAAVAGGGNVDIDGGAFNAPSARPLSARPAGDSRISLA